MMTVDIIIIFLELIILVVLLALVWFTWFPPQGFMGRGDVGPDLGERISMLERKLEEIHSRQQADFETLHAHLEAWRGREAGQYELEFDLLTELWEALLVLQRTALMQQVPHSEPDSGVQLAAGPRADLRAFAESFNALSRLVQTKKPFYPAEVYSVLVGIMTQAEREGGGGRFGSGGDGDQENPSEYWQKVVGSPEVFIDRIDEIGEIIRRRLTC